MTGQKLEQWTVLCTEAAEEHDATKFHELSRGIERMLKEKEQRLFASRENPKKDEGSCRSIIHAQQGIRGNPIGFATGLQSSVG